MRLFTYTLWCLNLCIRWLRHEAPIKDVDAGIVPERENK